MGAVEAVFAVIGVGFVALAALTLIGMALSKKPPKQPEEAVAVDDPAMPYREALYAAIQIQRAAQEAEHRIYTEARLHPEIDAGKQT